MRAAVGLHDGDYKRTMYGSLRKMLCMSSRCSGELELEGITCGANGWELAQRSLAKALNRIGWVRRDGGVELQKRDLPCFFSF